jgi:hypothetical protein
LVAGDFTIGAGFGTTPILAITAGSNDISGHFTVTCDATAAQATATIVIVFTDLAYPNAPHAIANVFSDNAITDSGSVRAVVTTTQITITLDVLPVDTKVYTFSYLICGK